MTHSGFQCILQRCHLKLVYTTKLASAKSGLVCAQHCHQESVQIDLNYLLLVVSFKDRTVSGSLDSYILSLSSFFLR